MGLDANITKYLLYAREEGVDFRRSATIGRQFLTLSATGLRRSLAAFGVEASDDKAQQILTEDGGYCEGFLRLLGAEVADSFDYSDFEGATCVHDFNEPIPPRWQKRYTAVFDGGSLEHVFQFPIALKNCMEMLEVGGHFVGITPANNFLGHGFYQFSPELFFRAFSPDNGFEMAHMLAFEHRPGARFYAVRDPEEIRSRVTLINCRKTCLAVLARKTAERPIFARPPLQSDYVSAWRGDSASPGTGFRRSATSRAVGRLIPRRLKDACRYAYWLVRPKFKKRFFRAITLAGVEPR